VTPSDARPAPIAAALEQARSLGTAARRAGSDLERAQWLTGLRQLIDCLEVTFTDVLRTFDAHGDGETLSAARSSAAWLHHELRMAPGDASSRVHVARARDELEGGTAAVAAGTLSFEHLRAVERALRPLTDPDQRAEAASLLVDLAERVDPGRVRAAGRRLREVVDPDGALTEHEQQFARRYLMLSPLLDGMTSLDGLLDTEATATLSAALAPLLVPAGPHDDRSTAQRRADALVAVATRALQSGDLPELSGSPVNVEVLVPVASLSPTGAPSGRPPGPAPATIVDHPGAPALLSSLAAARLACDAQIGRVVLGPDSVPLELGRRVRLFTADQRRAMSVRDGGCRFPGCSRPPRYTDAHHLVHWADGGASDLSNGALLCRWHHRAVHEGGWHVERVPQPRHASGDETVQSLPDAQRTLVFVGPRGQRGESPPRGP